jgi:hypothetical protein
LTSVGERGFGCWQFQQISKSSSNSAQAGHFHIMGGVAFRPLSKISCHRLNIYHTFARFLCGREPAMLAEQSRLLGVQLTSRSRDAPRSCSKEGFARSSRRVRGGCPAWKSAGGHEWPDQSILDGEIM